jgi:hypothetical protein
MVDISDQRSNKRMQQSRRSFDVPAPPDGNWFAKENLRLERRAADARGVRRTGYSRSIQCVITRRGSQLKVQFTESTSSGSMSIPSVLF